MQARVIEEVFRREGGRVLAGLIRRFGDFSLAEDLLQDACRKALERWPREGLPANPAAWLAAVARNAGLDHMRRAAHTLADSTEALALLAEEAAPEAEAGDDIGDDRLRLIFTCCHPALAPEAQAALALRTLCGLSTREIARAFCEAEATTAQRIVRAKRKIATARIPYEVPGADAFGERRDQVLQVIYLLFNEGYGASGGSELVRHALCDEAIRLARLLVALLPDDAEALGLLALLLLQHARRAARLSARGSLVTLEQQDRSLWDQAMIEEGLSTLDRALPLRRSGPYQLQAAIAALHAKAARAEATDWRQIAALYGALLRFLPTPVVELNAAVACGMADGPLAGLARIAVLEARGALDDFHYLHAAKAELLRRAGRPADAQAAYRRAIALAANQVERDFLDDRLASLD